MAILCIYSRDRRFNRTRSYPTSTCQFYFMAEIIQVNPYLSFTLPLISLSSGGGFVVNSLNTTPPSDKAEKTFCVNASSCRCAWMETLHPISRGHIASAPLIPPFPVSISWACITLLFCSALMNISELSGISPYFDIC